MIASETSSHLPNHPQGNFPWKRVWKAKAPSRVAFFVWTAALGKILTMDNLRKRQLIILDWCCMCKSSGETVNHLLLHCPIAWELWNMVLIIFGTSWVMPWGVEDLLCCWTGVSGKSEAAKTWKWPLTVSCGAFGRNVMTELLREWKILSQPLNSNFCSPFLSGQRPST